MKLKSTQFNFINSEDGPWDKTEEWNANMEDGKSILSLSEQEPEQSPSDYAVNRILDFARSYQTVPSRSLKFIDFYMN